PIATIFLIWAISGDVGPAESTFHLQPRTPGWKRGISFVVLALATFSFWRGFRAKSWRKWTWYFNALVAVFVGVFAGAGIFLFSVRCAGAVPGACAATGAGAVTGAVIFTVAFAVSGAVFDVVTGPIVDVVTGAVTGARAVPVAVPVAGYLAVFV